jgi:curved DNA-binding protein CbpA
MINDDFRLFGLTPDASLDDVKKAYRALAKKNHPDLNHNDDETMARINNAYREIIARLKKHGKSPAPAENDYTLYKKGAAIYDRYTGSISLKFKDITLDMDKLLEKKRDIEAAREYFARVLNEYPDSDWAYDSEERLKKIEQAFVNLASNIEFVRTHKIGKTPRGTPVWKEKE